MTLVHIEVLCGMYGKSAETLGLITWRTVEGIAPARVASEPADGTQPTGDDLRVRVEREIRAQIERELRLLIERDLRVALQQVSTALDRMLLGITGDREASDDE